MKPTPVIVTEVSGEPASTKEGVTAVMPGTGFVEGVGFAGTEDDDPPPQPVVRAVQDRTKARRATVARVMTSPDVKTNRV